MTPDERNQIRQAIDRVTRERVKATKYWKECPTCRRLLERSDFSPKSSACRACEALRLVDYRARQRALEAVQDSLDEAA